MAPSPKKSRLPGPLWLCLALGAALIGLVVIQSLKPAKGSYWGTKFNQPDAAAPIRLTDHRGQPFDLESQRGKVVLLNFGFTHCPNICPTILHQLNAVMEQLSPEEQKRVQVVFVSIDPNRDTAEVLRDYVPFFNESFIGLTGTPEAVADAAKHYHVFYKLADDAATNPSYNVDHSTYTYLIDPAGRFAVLYDDKKLTQPGKVANDIRQILAEKN